MKRRKYFLKKCGVFHCSRFFVRDLLVSGFGPVGSENPPYVVGITRGGMEAEGRNGISTFLQHGTESDDRELLFKVFFLFLGPEEELPRRLEHFTFVMHAPDDYFYYKNAPYPTMAVNRDQEYVLTRLGPKVRLLKSNGVAAFS